jgi:hypothetical protein
MTQWQNGTINKEVTKKPARSLGALLRIVERGATARPQTNARSESSLALRNHRTTLIEHAIAVIACQVYCIMLQFSNQIISSFSIVATSVAQRQELTNV